MCDESPELHGLVTKCRECGIEPGVFLNERMAELEHRKRILLTPTERWYRENRNHYEEFAERVLGRPLSEAERFGRHERLSEWIERKIFPAASRLALDVLAKNRLLQDYGARCAHCGRTLTAANMQVDHILPRAEGGSDEISNLQPLCRLCNQGKSAFIEDVAEAAARPWFEPTHRLLTGEVRLTTAKRYCAVARDGRRCRKCGRSSREVELDVTVRVSEGEGGQWVYDNLITLCKRCSMHRAEKGGRDDYEIS